MSDLISPRIIPDLPLSTGDAGIAFRFDEYAKTFARLIAERQNETPIAIGISGRWGSGKSTLLETIKGHLDSTEHLDHNLSQLTFVNPDDHASQFRRCRTVWFNAWKYSDEDELLVALLRVILQRMESDSYISKMRAKIASPFFPRRDVINTILSWFSFKTPFGDMKLNTGAPIETTFAKKIAFSDQFNEEFVRLCAIWAQRDLNAKKIESKKGVVVIFIDDLDRCLPEKTVQILEAIKLFLNTEGFAFVLAADEEMIRRAVEAHYERSKIKDQRASDYLEKIFQVRFPLPDLTSEQVQSYIKQHLDPKDELLNQKFDLITAAADMNPRQIKTLLNYLTLNWAIVRNSDQIQPDKGVDFIQWLILFRTLESFCRYVGDRDYGKRLGFINKAIAWSSGATMYESETLDPKEYENLFGAEAGRARKILRLVKFSSAMTEGDLDGFILRNIFFEQEEKRRREEEAKRRAEEEEAKQRAEEEAKRRAEEEAKRRAEEKAYWDNYFIEIPAGKFVMGSDKGSDDERPQHTVEIPYTYKIARYPVTSAEFAKFKPEKANMEKPDHPVVEVSWHEAREYCEWLQKNLQGATRDLEGFGEGLKVRLPTEAEWEKAARGEYGKEYPWGDEFDATKCNTRESGIGGTTPVGKYSPQGDSPYSVADMSGNVWEWCQSKYIPYPYDAKDGREHLQGDDSRVLRGGSFDLSQGFARGAYRYRDHPHDRSSSLGFRVVVSSIS